MTFATKMKLVALAAMLLPLLLACVQQNNVPGPRSLGAAGDRCWGINGVFELDCYHAEPLRVNPYPLTKEMLDRSVPYPTSDLLLHRAFHRAKKSGLLRIVVLGGSVTFGHDCISPVGLEGNDCAWPHRVEQWFQERIHDFQVEVTNQAERGEGILHFLHKSVDTVLPMDLEVDLVIVDFGINDAITELFNYNLDYVKTAHEALIRYVRVDMLQSPALLYYENFISPHRVREAPNQDINIADVHAEVARLCDIPMVSFRHAVWPDIDRPEVAERIWGEVVHPGWEVHQLMADVVVNYLQNSYARFLEVYGSLSDPRPSEEASQTFNGGLGCLGRKRSTRIDLKEYVSKEPPSQLESAQGWKFLDTPHGSGFFGYGNAAATPTIATFVLSCPGGSLDLEYLMSYEGMGAARVVVDTVDIEPPVSTTVIVDALWESRASVPWFQTIALPQDSTSIQVTIQVLSEEDAMVHRSALSDNGIDERNNRGDRKFRLLGIQCC